MDLAFGTKIWNTENKAGIKRFSELYTTKKSIHSAL